MNPDETKPSEIADEVEIDGQRMSIEEFQALPLARRIEEIMKAELVFYRDGSVIDRSAALRALRAERTRSG